MRRWAGLMYRRRRVVIAAWVLALVGLVMASGAVGATYDDDFTLPDSDSATAYDLLRERFPENDGDQIQVVFRAREGTLAEPGQARQQARDALAEVAASEQVAVVDSPFDAQGPSRVSPDGTIAYADVTFAEAFPDLTVEEAEPVVQGVLDRDSDVLQVEAGGDVAQFATTDEPGNSELIAVIAASIVLAVTFGTLVATAVPILSAVFALVAGLSTITLLSHLLPIGEFTPILASLIGLGVGIDYALFLVSRFRNELHGGATVEDAVVEAANTSGRAVLFAGVTVIIALLGLIALRVSFFTGVAIGAATTVGFTVLAAKTLLPALLGILGHKVDRLRLRPLRLTPPDHRTRWERWSDLVERRPIVVLLVGLVITTVLALPLLGMRLSFSDAGGHPEGSTTRKAYDLLAEGFGAGFNGPFLISATLEEPADAQELDGLVTALRGTDGVVDVTPPFVNETQDAALITVVPATSPQDEQTSELLGTIRDETIPAAVEGTGVRAYVGGTTAISEDFSRDLASKTPMFIAIVVLLSLLLLLGVFRSVVIPLKAAAMNFVSVTAAFGVVVAIFQWGWGLELVGLDNPGPVEPFVPAMMFAILFGLSMDYEVFLVSRMHEEWVHQRDNARAIRRGLSLTAGVITAAATIMIVVFAAFTPMPDRITKIFGIGLALAIFIDAFIIRTLIVPSVMHLLGRSNWYMPPWLERFVPRVSLEPPPGDGRDSRPQPEQEPESPVSA